MANTYTQIYVMIVFSVKGRMRLITKEYEEQIHKYVSKIVIEHSQKLICINGTDDHLHILVSIKPDIAISDLVRLIKSNSSKWINEEKGWFKGKFHWQIGFGGFSYSRSQLDDVIKYIKNQKEHHQSITFKEEYKKLLDSFSIEYDEKSVFD